MSKKSRNIRQKARKIIKEELCKAEIKYMDVEITAHTIKRVGVQGDQRTYLPPLELTFPLKQRKEIYEKCVEQISTRITNEVAGINGIIYAITR